MADAVVEFGINTSRFKRDLDTIERDARRTSVSIERSFRDAEARGFGVDPRVARTQRLATERDINTRLNADRLQANQEWVRQETRTRERLENRTRIFAKRQAESLKEPTRTGSRYAKSVVAIGVAVSATAVLMRGAAGAYRQYADKTSFARRENEALSRSFGKLGDVIGRTLAISGMPGLFSRIIDGGVSAFESAQDYLVADAHGSEVASSLRGSVRQSEAMDARIRKEQNFRKEQLKLEVLGGGEGADQARATLKQMSEVARLNAMQKAGQLEGFQVSQLAEAYRQLPQSGSKTDDRAIKRETNRMILSAVAARMRNAGDLEGAEIFGSTSRSFLDKMAVSDRLNPEQRTLRLGAIDAREAAEIAATKQRFAQEKQDKEARRQRVLEGYRFRAEEARIDRISDRGNTKEADRLRVELRLKKEILDVERNEALLQDDRARIIQGLTLRSQADLERIASRKDPVSVRTIGTGVGDALIRRQTLGGGMEIPNQQLAESKKQTALQEKLVDQNGMYA